MCLLKTMGSCFVRNFWAVAGSPWGLFELWAPRDWVAKWKCELDLVSHHKPKGWSEPHIWNWMPECNPVPGLSHAVRPEADPRLHRSAPNLSLAAHRGPGLEAGKLWILWPRLGSHPLKTIGREKREVSLPLPVASLKTSKTRWTGLKSPGGFFFFFLSFIFYFPFFFLYPSETLRSGVRKVQRQNQKGSTRLTTKTEKLRQMSLSYPIKLSFYCFCVLLLSLLFFPLLFY